MANGLNTFVGITDYEKVGSALTAIGDAFVKFGEALSAAPLLTSESRAEGIGALINNISTLTDVLPGFLEMDMAEAENALTILGSAFKEFGTALSNTPILFTSNRAEGIGILCSNIDALATSLPAFIAANSGSDVEEVFGQLGTAFSTFGSSLANSPFVNVEGRASAVTEYS